jgi:CheY-like chemotaxis protein
MGTAPHILVVEDDRDTSETLSELLRAEGFEVDVAADGTEAIEQLETSAAPGCVLVDLLMPGIVGQELLEYMRTVDRFSTVAIAIVSGSPQLAPAGYRVFPKPIELERLLEFVREGCATDAHN